MAVALLVGWSVTGTVARAEADRSRWGATGVVVVAASDVAPGDLLDEANTSLETLPLALLPDGTLDALPPNRRSSIPLHAGEPVLRDRLAGSTRGALAARLPIGTAGVTFPRAEARPELVVGDRVDVYATVEDAVGSTSVRVATAASVVAIGADDVTLAVPLDEVRGAAGASSSTDVAMVVLR